MAPKHQQPHSCSVAPIPSPNTRVHPVVPLTSRVRPQLVSMSSLLESSGASQPVASLTLPAQTGRYLYQMALHNWKEDGLPARMNFDQSERRKLSLRDCHGRFQERDNFYPKQTYTTVFIAVQSTSGNRHYDRRCVLEIWSVYDSSDMLYGPKFEGWQLPNWRAKPAPRRKQTRFTSVTALKHKLP